MSLARFRLQHFRNITEAELSFSPQLNLIIGANASGKTSLLEAIYFLGHLRSFRTTKTPQLIQDGTEHFVLFGEATEQGITRRLGVERSSRSQRVHIDGCEPKSVAELASILPLLLIDPHSHELLEQGPGERRRFLDWGVFHVEQGFHPVWSRYRRALKQRNAALRSADPRSATAWDAELAAGALEIHRLRERYLERLLPRLPQYTALAHEAEIGLRYVAGWPVEEDFMAVLRRQYVRDRELGHTSQGPHRTELIITLDGRPAQAHVSRGQQKVLVAAMKLAQAALFTELTGRRSLILIDDLPAELDAGHREALMACLQGMDAQIFVTAIEPGLIDVVGWSGARVFHVERGQAQEMVY